MDHLKKQITPGGSEEAINYVTILAIEIMLILSDRKD
jgi:hypothetical protein